MTLADFRSNTSWKHALELGPELMEIAEALPAGEELGLSLQLRQLMVELPASIAMDLSKGTEHRHLAGFKLLAALELIDKVYPALDTANARAAADRLVEGMMGSGSKPAPAHAPEAAKAPAPAPADVPVVPEPGAPAETVSPTRIAVAGQSSEEINVHPNSPE